MSLFRKWTASLVGGCMALIGNSAEFSIPAMANTPGMDGLTDKQEWRGTLIFAGAPVIEHRKVSFFSGWCPEGLYLAMESEMPSRGDFPVKGKNIVMDDSLEFWFVPPEDKRREGPFKQGKFQFIITHAGRLLSIQHDPGWGLADRDWESHCRIRQTKKNGTWRVELFFPASAFGFEKLIPGVWKMFFGRNFGTEPVRQIRYSDAGNEFLRTEFFSSFTLSKSPVAARMEYSPGTRIPASFSVIGAQTQNFTVETEIGAQKEKRILPGGTSLNLENQVAKSGETPIAVQISDSSGQILLKRSVLYAPSSERLWYNRESFAAFQHNFQHGCQKPDDSTFPDSRIEITGKAPEWIAGREKGSQALLLPAGSKAIFRNVRFQGPGAILLWLKPLGKLTTVPSRYFGTGNPPARYLFYQESISRESPFAHFGCHNLMNPTPLVYNLTATGKTLKNGEWNLVVVNMMNDRCDLYINGRKFADKICDFGTENMKFGEFYIGGTKSSMALGVSEVAIYSRPLTIDEILQQMTVKNGIAGSLLWYPSLHMVAAEIAVQPEENSDLELRVTDSMEKIIFRETFRTSRKTVPGSSEKKSVMFRKKFRISENLPDGDYRVQIIDPKTKAVLKERFCRMKNYPWMGNRIGMEDKVLPPFTPVRLDGRILSAVLRDYRLGENGLPEQVISCGKTLLAEPISIKVEKNGSVESMQGSSFSVKSVGDTRIEYSAKLHSSLLNANFSGCFEQDGLLKFDLQFKTSGKTLPDRVYLDIPVKKEIAELFHAAGEGLRSNPAGFLPEGTGVIYHSRSLKQMKISNFIPYLWVGGDELGICYAADWDQGWWHTKKRDAVELIRDPNGTIRIRLNLLNDPVIIESSRIMTLGIMASPVKPMPEGWRGWCDGFKFKANRNAQCHYSAFYWGGYSGMASRYPAFEDFTYIRKLMETAKTGKVDKTFRENWLKRIAECPVEQAPIPRKRPDGMKAVTDHFDAAHWHMKQLHGMKKIVVYPYTCSYYPTDTLPEYNYFSDEWKDMHVYGSYADYAIYYLDKMLEAGFGGVYNDNTYLTSNYDWVTGQAWIDDDGNVHPSLGVWRNREYHRRQLETIVDHGLDPWLTVHQTNSNVLPALGFATNSMGMEWKYGITDYQERFTSDYIRTVNQGRQGGFFPTVLDGIPKEGTTVQRSWCTRTMLATLLPHEIRPTAHRCSDAAVYQKVHDILFDFGIYKKDCVVWQFWRENREVSVSDSRLLVTSYRRGRKMLLVCGNYADNIVAEITCPDTILSAVNAETEKPLEVHGRKLVLPVAKHDLVLVLLNLK